MKTKFKSKTDKPARAQTLRSEFHDAHVQAVSIAGTFNDWRPGATPMIPLGRGQWIKELSLPPGRD